MRIITTSLAATALLTSAAMGDGIAPSAVKFDDGAVMAALTSNAGDAAAGRDVFKNRKQGNCLACHINAEMPNQSFQGEVGPELTGVADRWEEGELRAIVANAKMVFEDTIMPAFYIDTGYARPLKKFDGKSILSAQQVEDVVAYLMTLKEQ